jgi:hypothetical protein
MELSNLLTVTDHEAGAECNIVSPVDGKPTDVYILLAGADSSVWRKAKRKQTTEIMAAARSKAPVDLDYDAMDIAALVDATIGWRGIVSGGQPYEFSKENALALYSGSPGIVNQLLDFIADKRNFINGWSRSSSGSGAGVFTSTLIQKAPRSAGTKRSSRSRKV